MQILKTRSVAGLGLFFILGGEGGNSRIRINFNNHIPSIPYTLSLTVILYN